MSMLPKELCFTYSEYKDFPPDDKRYEILEGRLLMVPSPFIPHQSMSRNIELCLYNYVKEKNLGKIFNAPCDVILSEINVVQPDIIFVSNEKINIITYKNIKGAPDLLIEILSDSSKKNDTETKKKIYAQSNVKEYWIVDPEEKNIKVFTNLKKRYVLWKEFFEVDLLSTPAFPELKMNLKEVLSWP